MIKELPSLDMKYHVVDGGLLFLAKPNNVGYFDKPILNRFISDNIGLSNKCNNGLVWIE